MADASTKYSDNVSGTWFVDKKCITCSVCEQVAPKNFRIADAGDHNIVYKQPANEEELAESMDALAQCPVDAIGLDADMPEGLKEDEE